MKTQHLLFKTALKSAGQCERKNKKNPTLDTIQNLFPAKIPVARNIRHFFDK